MNHVAFLLLFLIGPLSLAAQPDTACSVLKHRVDTVVNMMLRLEKMSPWEDNYETMSALNTAIEYRWTNILAHPSIGQCNMGMLTRDKVTLSRDERLGFISFLDPTGGSLQQWSTLMWWLDSLDRPYLDTNSTGPVFEIHQLPGPTGTVYLTQTLFRYCTTCMVHSVTAYRLEGDTMTGYWTTSAEYRGGDGGFGDGWRAFQFDPETNELRYEYATEEHQHDETIAREECVHEGVIEYQNGLFIEPTGMDEEAPNEDE